MSYEWEPVEAGQTGWSQRKRFFMGCLAFLVVIAMLASAFAGGIWLWQTWRESQVAANDDGVSPPVAVASTDVPEQEEDAAEPEPETAEPTVASTPTSVPITHNRIAFVNQRGQVETIAPDGADRRQLTDTDQRFQFPAWSPNGESLAVIGADRSGAGVYLLEDTTDVADPAERYFSTTQGPFYLYWSPDGNYISFLSNYRDDSIALRLASAAGDEEERILATGSPFYWHWMTDSTGMLIHTGSGSDEPRLALLNADGESDEENIAQPGLFQAPAMSADGRFWAYATEQAAGMSSVTILDTVTEETWDQRHAGVVAVGWSPTRNQIAIISGPPDSTEFFGPLRLVDAETGEGRLLSQETVLAFFWSPDGRYLAYISASIFDDDVQAGTGQKRAAKVVLTQSPSFEFRLNILDIDSGNDRRMLTFQPTLTFFSQFLPYFDQYAHSHRLWSPDSSALVLPIRENRENKIVIIPANGDSTREVAEGDMPFWSQR